MLGLQVSKIRIFPPSQTGASEQGWGYKGEVATGLMLRNHRSRILRGGPSPSSARSALRARGRSVASVQFRVSFLRYSHGLENYPRIRTFFNRVAHHGNVVRCCCHMQTLSALPPARNDSIRVLPTLGEHGLHPQNT